MDTIKRFNEFLTETSLSRIWQQFGQKDFPAGMMSAHRSEFRDTPDRSEAGKFSAANAARSNQLGAEIRSAGFGYGMADGHFIETGKDGQKIPVAETTLIIAGTKNDGGRLKGYMRKWMADFDQDSVIYKPEGTDHVFFLERGGGEVDGGVFHPGLVSEFMTKLRGRSGGTFVFGEAYIPMNWFGRAALRARQAAEKKGL